MTDERSNEQIVAEVIGFAADRWAEAIVAALSAAGRLVTPEHDAKVRGEVLSAIRNELDHAFFNEHRLTDGDKGVRTSNMEAVIERFTRDEAAS